MKYSVIFQLFDSRLTPEAPVATIRPVGIYKFLNVFFFVFHSLIILFNLTGWIWKKTRIPHLILLGSTGFSWFILGIWYGIGYCPCTDWHWQVREILGYDDPPASYIQFLLHELTPIRLPDRTVDTVVVICLLVPALLSISLLTRGFIQRRRHSRGASVPSDKRG